MEKNCKELASIAAKTHEIHRKVKASNMLSAELENVQAASRASEGQNFYLSYYNKIYIVHNIMVKQPTLSSYFYFEFEAIFVAKRLF